jgi:hypothetical protein
MANPIVFDCGGSTRIKKLLASGKYGAMNGLLDVGDLTPPPALLPGTGPLPGGATGSQQKVDGPYVSMSLMFQDSTGVPFLVPVNPLPNSFLISSTQDQNVRGDFVANPGGAGPDLVVTVYSTVSDPLVEAKQGRDLTAKKGRRRYVVANAGAIRTLMINDTLPLVFDSNNPAIPPVAPGLIGPTLAGGAAAVPAPGFPLYVSLVIMTP